MKKFYSQKKTEEREEKVICVIFAAGLSTKVLSLPLNMSYRNYTVADYSVVVSF